MKKKSFIYLLLVIIFGCNESEFTSELNEVSKVTTKISLENALAMADEFFDELDVTTRGERISRQIGSVEVLGKEKLLTRSRDVNESLDTLLYLVNYSGDNGFALLAADKRLDKPFYAISDEGSLSLSDTATIPALSLFFKGLDEVIMSMVKAIPPIEPGPGPGPIQWTITRSAYCTVSVKWDQGSPFNRYCFTTTGQQAKAGCAAIAIAQIMSYFSYPNQYAGITFNWAEMNKVKSASLSSASVQGTEMIAKLINQIGINIAMDYGVSSSGASPYLLQQCFQTMGYTNTSSSSIRKYGMVDLFNSLDNGSPVCVVGYADEGGHAWVADGYIVREGYQGENWVSLYQNLVRCNYGWGGKADGYYEEGIFNTITGPVLEGSSNGSYNFNKNLMLIPYLKK